MSKPEVFEFRIPYEEPAPSLEVLLARAWPELEREAIESVAERGHLRVGDHPVHRLDRALRPEGMVEVEAELPEASRVRPPRPETLARGDGWVVVDKPIGMPGRVDPDDPMHPLLFVADSLGIDRESFAPVWPMPTHAGGPWLCGTSPEAAAELRLAWRDGDLMTTWVVLVPRPDIPSGMLRPRETVEIQYSASTMQGGLAELQLTPRWIGAGDASPDDVVSPLEVALEGLADAGRPVLADRRRGGYMVEGGMRARLAALFRDGTDLQQSWTTPSDWWPEAPVRTPPDERDEPELDLEHPDLPELVVAPDCLDHLRAGRRTRLEAGDEIGRRGALRPGALVQLVDPEGRTGPTALFEGRDDRLADVWSHDPVEASDFEGEIERRFDEAVARRAPMLREADRIERFRLVHGRADGLPGFVLDRFGPLLRATIERAAGAGLKERVYERLALSRPETLVVELDARPDHGRETGQRTRIVRGESHYLEVGASLILREGSLRYRCNPWEYGGVDVELAHRIHRRRIAELAEPDDHWLQLAPLSTGLGLALAASGARVTLSHPSDDDRAHFESRLELNRLDVERHESVVGSVRQCLETLEGDVDGATVAWHESMEEETMLEACFQAVRPGGRLLVYRPEIERERLEGELEEVASRAGCEIAGLDVTDPPVDVPVPSADPRGSMRGWLVELEA
jgi:23S rRNA G2069 N7-methylase RlmK/C1962 C5-methylase RlmI